MVGVLCWLVALCAVVFLAYEEKEGWGWIIFLMICCGVPNPSGDVTDLDGRLKDVETRLEQKAEQVEKRVEKIDKIISEPEETSKKEW